MKREREEDSLGRDGKRPEPTHIPYSSADGEAVHHVPPVASNSTKGSRIRDRRALKIPGESPGYGIPTRLRAAGGTPQESRPRSPSAPFPSGYLGRPSSGLRLPPIGAGDEQQGPAPAPAQPASGVRAAARPEAPRRPAASPRPAPGRKRPCPGRSTRRRARPALSHLRTHVRHERRLGRLGAAATADSPFPQHSPAWRSSDARQQRRRLTLGLRQRPRPPAPAAGAPPIPRAAAAAVPPASGSAADTVRPAQVARPAHRPWDTPTAALASQAGRSRPQPWKGPRPRSCWPERLSAFSGFLLGWSVSSRARPPGRLLIGAGRYLKRYLL